MEPRIVANWERLIEFVGESIKERGIGSSRNRGVDNGEGNCTVVVGRDFEANREARISVPKNKGGQVEPADTDQIAIRVASRNCPEGIESPSCTGDGGRALGQDSLHDRRDFGGSDSRGRLFAFAFATMGSCAHSNSLVKFASATMDNISVKSTGRGNSGLGRDVSGDYRRGGSLGRLGLPKAGLEGGGGAEEEGVGRRTAGVTRRARSETELQSSQIFGPTRELATWEPRSCILV